jgi:DNA-directed RNA polymerase specialized sigma24 family protein
MADPVMGSTVMTAVPNWDIVDPAGTDADLARAAAAGDRAAFAGIYDRYADRLHDFCVGMLRDRDGAADCVQDTFCIAATRL